MTGLRLVFSEGFRVFFLAAGIFAVAAMSFWLVWLGAQAAGGAAPAPFAPAPPLWHAHEMIWGYAGAVLGGFFLTAAPNWTGARPSALPFLALVSGLWLAGRLAVAASGWLPPGLVAVVDLAYLPVLASKLAAMLIRRPKPQNVMFLGMIALLWAGNLAVHLAWTGLVPGAEIAGIHAGLLTLAALIAIIGGRITPAFTRNALRRAGVGTALPRETGRRDALGIAAAILLAVLALAGAPEPWLAGTALAAGALQGLRLAGWRAMATLDQPILWSMHLAYGVLVLGYLALGAAFALGTGVTAGLHVLGIGAIGAMTLTVMSRASLGHTGRALALPRPVVAGVAALVAATLLRAAGSWAGAGWYWTAMLGAAALWVAAFGLWLACLWSPLTRPRAGSPS